MLKNYFKITIRSLLKNSVYSFINITGLSIGIASSILIFLGRNIHDTFTKKQWQSRRGLSAFFNFLHFIHSFPSLMGQFCNRSVLLLYLSFQENYLLIEKATFPFNEVVCSLKLFVLFLNFQFASLLLLSKRLSHHITF